MIEITTERYSEQEAMIKIRDTGRGMDKRQLKEAFEPFYTTKPSGTGFGLSIASSIIKQHGGTISMHSRLGQGTTVSIRLKITGH
jgi:signal transduction histidine kinase